MNKPLKEIIDVYFATIDDFYEAKEAFIDDVNLILKKRGDRDGVICVAKVKESTLEELSKI